MKLAAQSFLMFLLLMTLSGAIPRAQAGICSTIYSLFVSKSQKSPFSRKLRKNLSSSGLSSSGLSSSGLSSSGLSSSGLSEEWSKQLAAGNTLAQSALIQLETNPNMQGSVLSFIQSISQGSPGTSSFKPLSAIDALFQSASVSDRDRTSILSAARNIDRHQTDFALASTKFNTEFNQQVSSYLGRNQMLQQIVVAELALPSATVGYIDSFIQSERYREPSWWISSKRNQLAEINHETSKSIAQELYPDDFEREVFWLKPDDLSNHVPELDRVRIVVNKNSAGQRLSTEVLIRDNQNEWQPFFYEWNGTSWVPAKKIGNLTVEEKCAQCHVNLATRKISPRPSFLRNETDFFRVGYKNGEVIRKMLTY